MVKAIIEKDGKFFISEAHYFGGKTLYRFGPSAYDAKRYKNPSDARRKAKMIGGKVKLFDSIHGEVIGDANEFGNAG